MPIYTIRSGVPKHPETSVLQHLTDMVLKGGVLNLENDLLVIQPGGGGLNVDIGTGRCFLKKDGNAYPVRNDSTITQAIASNASGNPRIDSIVVYLDLAATPDGVDSQGEDVIFTAAVQGTPAASPSAPNESQIESAIGAANPYLVLANVDVANGASGISTGDITQVAPRVFMRTPKPDFEIDYAASVTPDYEDGDQQKINVTGNITVNAPSNMKINDWLMVKIIQDATGGRSVTWFSGITWLSADISPNTDSNKVSVFAFKKTGASSYDGYLVGKEY